MAGRVLITGATGFLGGALLQALKDRPLLAQGRSGEKLAALGVPSLTWDLRRGLPAEDIGEIDAIIHCAGLSSPFGPLKDFRAANVTGTANVIALARKLRVRRLVHISSPSVLFAPRDQLDLDETAPLPKPYTAYASSKAEAEALVRHAPDLSPIILRPRGIYGAGDTALLPRLLQVARSRPLPLFRQGAARIDLTHVEDVAAACRAALEAGPELGGEIFHISGGEYLPVTEIASRACTMAGVDLRWRKLPFAPVLLAATAAEKLALLRGGKEPAVTRYGLALFAFAQSLNISKARRLLGWRPKISFDEGLDRTFTGRQ